MTRKKPLPVPTARERDLVAAKTFDQMATWIMLVRDGRLDPHSPEGKAKLDEFYPRMHWLFYVAQIASHGIGVFDPAYYGLPDDEPLLKPEHRK